MKRLQFFSLIIITILLISCTGVNDVGELLKAPEMHEYQSEIMTGLKAYIGGDLVLRFPSKGNNRQPIQFYDLDGDGTDEVVAFYYDEPSSMASIAILKRMSEAWVVQCTYIGSGVNVVSVSPIRRMDRTVMLWVEWSGAGGANTITPLNYEYDQNDMRWKLVSKFDEESISETLFYDLNDDKTLDAALFVTRDEEGFCSLRYVDVDSFNNPIVIKLDSRMVACSSLLAGELPDGKKVVYIDEQIQSINPDEEKLLITETFLWNRKSLVPAVTNDLDIKALSERPVTAPNCHFFTTESGGREIYIPSKVRGEDEQPGWTYWYAIETSESAGYQFICKLTSFVYVDPSNRFSFAMIIPDEWVGISFTDVLYDDANKSWQIFGMGVEEGPVLTIIVLSIDDRPEKYTDNGYDILAVSGTTRFVISVCDELQQGQGDFQQNDYDFVRNKETKKFFVIL